MRILLLAAVAAALIVPFGFALSNDGADRSPLAVARAAVPFTDVSAASAKSVAVPGTVIALPELPEGAKLFAIGTVLFALGAAMRRSN